MMAANRTRYRLLLRGCRASHQQLHPSDLRGVQCASPLGNCTSFRAAAAASLILLSACASKPAIEVRTVRVEVPVPVACVAIADVPERPGPLPPRPEDARQALDLAVAWALKWQGYGEKANAVLQGCVSQ